MAECKDHEISQGLLAALAPEEFPEWAKRIEEHVRECQSCAEELETLRILDSLIRKHREELADSPAGCPEPGALVEAAIGEKTDPHILKHVQQCPDCQREFELVRQLVQEDPSLIAAPMGTADETPAQGGPSLAQRIFASIRDFISVPSLALGAAAAAIIAFVLLPGAPKEVFMRPVLSDVDWQASRSIDKELMAPKSVSGIKTKVAVVLLVADDDPISPGELERVYRQVRIAEELGNAFEFVSPADLKKRLSTDQCVRSASAMAAEVFHRDADPQYVLTFEIFRSADGNALKGTLFRRGRLHDMGSISQTGLALDRIPSRINAIGADLLSEPLGAERKG
jgi:hypothetical protein